jgi:hypothetical protein
VTALNRIRVEFVAEINKACNMFLNLPVCYEYTNKQLLVGQFWRKYILHGCIKLSLLTNTKQVHDQVKHYLPVRN